MFAGEGNSNLHDFLLTNSISGSNDMCHDENFKVIDIQMYKGYSMYVELCNSRFYNITHNAVYIRMVDTNTSSLLIRKCNFTDIKNYFRPLQQIVYGELVNPVTTVMFENFTTIMHLSIILKIEFNGLCMHPFNVTMKNCDFIGNDGSLLYTFHLVHHCKTNIFLNEIINFANNKVVFI